MLRVRVVDTREPACARRVLLSNVPARTLVFSRVKEHKPRKQMQSNEAGSAQHILKGPR
jgi:hypothetical protein